MKSNIDKLKVAVMTGVAMGLTPRLAFAQDLQGIIGIALGILRSVVVLILALALIKFIWDVSQYISKGYGETSKITWDVIVMFVMVSVWGLVALINNTLKISAGGTAPDISF